MILVDGKKIAQDIYAEVKQRVERSKKPLLLLVFTCDPNLETVRYLELKKNKAKQLGIELEVVKLDKSATTEKVVEQIKSAKENCQGILVQLPLPATLDTDAILGAIPKSHDVDAFSYQGEETEILPPVIGAINRIIKVHELDLKNKSVVVFGAGRLVGQPAAIFARSKGAKVIVVDKDLPQEEVIRKTEEADFIILGVGKPGLLKPEMVKAGVVVFDAGASEDGGVLVGDATSTVALKARVLTPVPGGIGPITVALLFFNLVNLTTRQ